MGNAVFGKFTFTNEPIDAIDLVMRQKDSISLPEPYGKSGRKKFAKKIRKSFTNGQISDPSFWSHYALTNGIRKLTAVCPVRNFPMHQERPTIPSKETSDETWISVPGSPHQVIPIAQFHPISC